MKKVIIKAANKGNIGEVVKGTGPGSVYPAMTANKYSKEFVLKGDSWPGMIIIGAKKGDKVVFAYV